MMTEIQNLAVNLVYRALGESRINRTIEEYAAIAARLPPLKVLLGIVNDALAQFLEEYRRDFPGQRPEFCRFKAGHKRIVYETYPDKISIETLRSALVAHGFREPRLRRRAP